jgi:DNA-binding transcriptional ArsR family regulator
MLQHPMTGDVFHALGDPTRRAMVEALATGTKSVSALAAPLGISLAAVVQHVQVLERCGLVQTEKIGRVRTCRMDPRGLNEVERWASQRRQEWSRHLDKLGEYLLAEDAKREGELE